MVYLKKNTTQVFFIQSAISVIGFLAISIYPLPFKLSVNLSMSSSVGRLTFPPPASSGCIGFVFSFAFTVSKPVPPTSTLTFPSSYLKSAPAPPSFPRFFHYQLISPPYFTTSSAHQFNPVATLELIASWDKVPFWRANLSAGSEFIDFANSWTIFSCKSGPTASENYCHVMSFASLNGSSASTIFLLTSSILF